MNTALFYLTNNYKTRFIKSFMATFQDKIENNFQQPLKNLWIFLKGILQIHLIRCILNTSYNSE